jgi:hypothetical protein
MKKNFKMSPRDKTEEMIGRLLVGIMLGIIIVLTLVAIL